MDGRRHCGEFGVGEVNCRHGTDTSKRGDMPRSARAAAIRSGPSRNWLKCLNPNFSRAYKPRALGDRRGASALGPTIAPPHDDATPQKWGCARPGVEASAAADPAAYRLMRRRRERGETRESACRLWLAAGPSGAGARRTEGRVRDFPQRSLCRAWFHCRFLERLRLFPQRHGAPPPPRALPAPSAADQGAARGDISRHGLPPSPRQARRRGRSIVGTARI
jgi:hypothetical protein